MITVGATVHILPIDAHAPEYHGKIGTLCKIDDSDEGDAFGVHLDGDPEGHLVYFTQKELEEIFADYNLDINAPIWTRKQPEPIAK